MKLLAKWDLPSSRVWSSSLTFMGMALAGFLLKSAENKLCQSCMVHSTSR
jgi:hypothetical protein